MDLAVLFGTSPGPLANERFAAQKELVKGILKQMDISMHKTRVSFILQDSRPVIVSKLGDVKSKHDAARLIDSIRNPERTSPMENVLKFINNTVFSVAFGARPGVAKSILYFVDTEQARDPSDVSDFAQKLRADNVKLVIVGQGISVNKEAVRPLAYNEQSVFFPPDLKTIDGYITPVTDALKHGILLSFL